MFISICVDTFEGSKNLICVTQSAVILIAKLRFADAGAEGDVRLLLQRWNRDDCWNTLRTRKVASTRPFPSSGPSTMNTRANPTSSAVSARTERERRWRPLLLGLLLLCNLLYVGLGVALTMQNPDKVHLHEDILLEDLMISSTYSGKPTSQPTAAANGSQVAADIPSNSSHVRRLACRGWRATGGAAPMESASPSRIQTAPAKSLTAHQVEDKETHEVFRVMKRSCVRGKPGVAFRCIDAPGFANFRAEAQQVIDKISVPGYPLQ